MEKERKLIIAGNWKMNKTVAESLDLANGLVRELKDATEVDIAVCPPFTALAAVSEVVIDSNIRLGAQNMSENGYGAHTGEIAAGMLKEFSAKYVILGHSERRQYQRESDELVAAKAKKAGYTLVLDKNTLVFTDGSADLTKGVLVQLNANDPRKSSAPAPGKK
jgi:triosephosphate isomerase